MARSRVDQQPGETGKDGGGAEPGGQRPRQRRSADVIGDMPLELGGLEPQADILLRNPVRRVIAEQDEAATPPSRHNFASFTHGYLCHGRGI